jgi:hypothetical protein
VRFKRKTYLVLAAAHLPPLVVLSLPHVLEEEPPPAFLRVLAPLEHGVRARVAGGKAKFAVAAVAVFGGGAATNAAAED